MSSKSVCQIFKISFQTGDNDYSNERLTFLNIIRNIDSNILSKNDLKVTETPLYVDGSYGDTNNTLIMNTTMEFLFASKKFDVSLV